MCIRILLLLLGISCSLQAQLPQPVTGTLERHADFPSDYVKARHIDVWLPEGYTPAKKYPVLYMHDGQNLFDTALTFNRQEWGVDETFSRLLEEKRIGPVIVVGIWNTADRRTEYFPQKVFASLPRALQDSLRKDFGTMDSSMLSDRYLKFITGELKPFIDKTYSTYQDPGHTSIAGSSMGGLISLYAVCEYPALFGAAACLSTHWPGSVYRNDPAVADAFMHYLHQQLPAPKKHRFYFDYGTATLDSWYEPYQWRIDAVMRGKSIRRSCGSPGNLKEQPTKKMPGAAVWTSRCCSSCRETNAAVRRSRPFRPEAAAVLPAKSVGL